MKKFLGEPLLHFLLIGAGLFLLFGWRGGSAPLPGGQSGPRSSRIVVTQGDVDQLVEMFRKTWQRPPTDEEMKGLVDNFVRDEIYYREALAIGLDRDDALIRRRMRQKMEFILEDVAAQGEPTDADLHAFMNRYPDRYLVDHRISFRHVYVNADKRRENAEPYARQSLGQLNEGVDPATLGDPFLMGSDVPLSPLWELKNQFGEAFGEALLSLKPGRWEGPVKSGFGLHLVFIEKRGGGRLPELIEVREILKRDWSAERQKELKDAAYAKLKQRYSVEMEKPKAAETSSGTEARPGMVTRFPGQ